MSIRYYLIVFALASISFCFPRSTQAQFLEWEYNNIIDDIQQSGANPDMQIDASGNIHISFWNAESDQLMYAWRDRANGKWTYEVVDNAAGFTSALTLDANGKVHIVYLKNTVGTAFLKYASNATGVWELENPTPTQDFGVYGSNFDYPVYAQASLDIEVQANGLPLISAFDATVFDIDPANRCNGLLIYTDYELKMRIIHKNPFGFWIEAQTGSIPYIGGGNCLQNGDRFGEFNKILPAADGSYLIFTNSLHNHLLMMFKSDPQDIDSWNYVEVGSVNNLMNPTSFQFQFRESHGFMDFVITEDKTLHIAHQVSDLYGNNQNTPLNRRSVYYEQYAIDSIGSATYSPFSFDFIQPRDEHLRMYLSLTARNQNELFLAYYDVDEEDVILTSSANAGQNWVSDTIYEDITTNASLKTAIWGDSLYVLTYDLNKDFLRLAAKAIAGGPWVYTQASQKQERGVSFDGEVVKVNQQEEFHIVFSESAEEQIIYGNRSGSGSWQYEVIETAVGKIGEIELQLNGNQEPGIAYILEDKNELRFAEKRNGSWTNTLVFNSGTPRELSLARKGNMTVISFFDQLSGTARSAVQTAIGGNFSLQLIDAGNTIIGKNPSVLIDDAGNIHYIHTDPFSQRLRYALKPASGTLSVNSLTAEFRYNVGATSLGINSEGKLVIAFRDINQNRIMYGEQLPDNSWEFVEVVKGESNLLGNPLQLLIDDGDNPWILYNFTGIANELRLLRRDEFSGWESVSVSNNTGKIADQFSFILAEKDFYVLGKKNAFLDRGLAYLYAAEGVTTEVINPNEKLLAWKVFPNPASDHVRFDLGVLPPQELSIHMMSVQGQSIRQYHLRSTEMNTWQGIDLEGISQGIYFIQLKGKDFDEVKKVIVRK